ncbi:MAG: PD-(D/E)XK nuclease family protein, partial [Oceanococcaceae bacterium]
LAPQALASSLQHSWQLCQAWRIEPESAPAWTAEQGLFQRLSKRFAQGLRDQGWITEAELPLAVLDGLQQGRIPRPAQVLCQGFIPDQLEPTQAELLAALGAQHPPPTPGQQAAQAWICTDNTEQWQQIALKIKAILQADAQAHIVVGVADLQQHAPLIDCVWRPLLAPWSLNLDEEEPVLPWQLELPGPLSAQPWVAALLDLCRLQSQELSFELISALLRQPLWFSAEERLLLSAAELKLRRQGLRFASTDWTQALPAEHPLSKQLQSLGDVVQKAPQKALGAQWLEHWQQRWACLPRTAADQHWARADALERALVGFANLCDGLPPLSHSAALYWLGEVLRDQAFTPSSGAQTQIILCSLEQAQGLPCSHLLLAGLSEQALPKARRPQPWINPELLRTAGWPGATQSTWLQQQQELAQALLQTQAEVHLYSAAQDERGTPSRPSSLLPASWERIAPAEPPAESLWADPRPESIPALESQRLAAQKGGSSLLRRQARSPFLALVHHRLEAQPLPPAPTGLSPALQGEWVHAVLADYWTAVRTSAALAAQSPEATQEQLQQIIQRIQPRFLPAHRFGTALMALEADRVLRLCARWLSHERKRRDPFEVLQIEAAFQEERGGLPLKLRLDRLDLVHTQQGPRYLVIDYKTGQADSRGWSSEQFLEPQLPLYATSQALHALGVERVDGICFARVHPSQPALIAATNWCERLLEEKLPQEPSWKEDWASEL